jgi:hypothetical protein
MLLTPNDCEWRCCRYKRYKRLCEILWRGKTTEGQKQQQPCYLRGINKSFEDHHKKVCHRRAHHSMARIRIVVFRWIIASSVAVVRWKAKTHSLALDRFDKVLAGLRPGIDQLCATQGTCIWALCMRISHPVVHTSRCLVETDGLDCMVS